MDSAADPAAFPAGGLPIQRSPDRRSLAAPRSLSQPATSFIAVLVPNHPPSARIILAARPPNPSRIGRRRPRNCGPPAAATSRPRRQEVLPHVPVPNCHRPRSAPWRPGDILLRLVEAMGFEPTTPGLQSRCSPAELRPRRNPGRPARRARTDRRSRVGSGRVELPTSSLSGTRSNQLSYEPGAARPSTRARAPEGPASRRQRGARDGEIVGRPGVRSVPSYKSRSSPIDPGLIVLRKEVIQPQVPLRLPCYDLAPITGLTFGTAPPCGLGKRLRALPALMA